MMADRSLSPVRCLRALATLGLSVVLLIGGPLAAQQEGMSASQIEEAQEAIGMIRSPYCPGFMLEVCPSPQAELLRDSIYDLAAGGMESDDIVEWAIANHGEEWRGLPKRSGAGLLAWIIPPIALLLGIGALVAWMKSSHNPKTEVLPEESDISGEDREQLAAALKEWEEDGAEEI